MGNSLSAVKLLHRFHPKFSTSTAFHGEIQNTQYVDADASIAECFASCPRLDKVEYAL